VGEAVSDGIQRVYCSSGKKPYRNPHTPDHNSSGYDHDLEEEPTVHLPRVIFNVEEREKSAVVDEAEVDSIWQTRTDFSSSNTCRPGKRRRRVFIHSVPMDSKLSDAPKEDRRGCSRCSACFRVFLAFVFSTVGLTFLLVGYSILGGLVFMKLEADHENRTADQMEKLYHRELQLQDELDKLRVDPEMEKLRHEHLMEIWNMTLELNVLYPDVWITEAEQILRNYTTIVYKYTKKMGWDGGGNDEDSQWSFAGSLLYAITVITTIGMLLLHCSIVRRTATKLTVLYCLLRTITKWEFLITQRKVYNSSAIAEMVRVFLANSDDSCSRKRDANMWIFYVTTMLRFFSLNPVVGHYCIQPRTQSETVGTFSEFNHSWYQNVPLLGAITAYSVPQQSLRVSVWCGVKRVSIFQTA